MRFRKNAEFNAINLTMLLADTFHNGQMLLRLLFIHLIINDNYFYCKVCIEIAFILGDPDT